MIRIAINTNNFAFILIYNTTNVFLYQFTIYFMNQILTVFYSKDEMNITSIIGIGHIKKIVWLKKYGTNII
jgi:hypothetical protein